MLQSSIKFTLTLIKRTIRFLNSVVETYGLKFTKVNLANGEMVFERVNLMFTKM